MKKIDFFFLFLCSFYTYHAICLEKTVEELSQKAYALGSAQDETQAIELYSQVLEHPLPIWQKARTFYNLGTLYLMQHQPKEALKNFYQINPLDLSLPSNGRDLFINEALSYLEETNVLKNTQQNMFLGSEKFLIQLGMQAFKKGEELECLIRLAEKKDSGSHCKNSASLEQGMVAAQGSFLSILKQTAEEWLKTTAMDNRATLLENALKNLIDKIRILFDGDKSATINDAYGSYFQLQSESLLELWNVFKEHLFEPSQKETVDQAFSSYTSGIEELTKLNFGHALEYFEEAKKLIHPYAFQEDEWVQQIRLEYQLLLLQDPPSISAMQHFLNQIDQIKDEKIQDKRLVATKKNLQSSIKELELHQRESSLFYLIAGYGMWDKVEMDNGKNKAEAQLKYALAQAERALTLSYLWSLIPEAVPDKSTLESQLLTQQEEVINRADAFIPAVIEDQKVSFKNANGTFSSCAISVWDQVISLFDRGYIAAKGSGKLLVSTPFIIQQVIIEQVRTVKEWRQVIDLLHNPSENTPESTQSAPSAKSQEMSENFRLIQEMFLQDQPKKIPDQKEFHSW